MSHTVRCARSLDYVPFITPCYAATRTLDPQMPRYARAAGRASDVWALGCILYEMCTLKHAFESDNLLGLVFKIVSEEVPPIPDRYGDEVRDLTAELLCKDPSKRPTARQILSRPCVRAALKRLADSSGAVGGKISRPRLDTTSARHAYQ